MKHIYKVQIVKTDGWRYELNPEKYYQTTSTISTKTQVKRVGKFSYYKYITLIK